MRAVYGGEGGIRTHETSYPRLRDFQSRSLSQLGHLSARSPASQAPVYVLASLAEKCLQKLDRLVGEHAVGAAVDGAPGCRGEPAEVDAQFLAELPAAVDPCGENATLDELREENKRLRRQLRRAELEREILKKATAYFAKESL